MDKKQIRFLMWLYEQEIDNSNEPAIYEAFFQVREEFKKVFGFEEYMKEPDYTPHKKMDNNAES